jgi:CRP-like cAMP-binding protein
MANRSQTALIPANRLLSALPSDEFTRLQPHLEPVTLRTDQVLVVPGDEVRYGYFPLDGIVSMLMVLEDGTPVEVANIGNEGFADSASILSIATSPFEIMAQSPGHALRITVEALRHEFRESVALRELLLRFCGVVLTITGRSLACNITHTPEQRLAKWLMLARDRTVGDDLPYTQESLARILRVRRATVSEAAEALRDRGLIKYHRGHIRVSDRVGLQQAACADYQAFIDEYERLLGPAPAHGPGDNTSAGWSSRR